MDAMDADLVVIGAGALGLSTALHAALLGQSVIVVDRYAAGSQASGRAAGLFKSVQADELRTRLARRSIELALTFGDWAGVGLAVARSGSFLVARTPEHAAYLRSEARQSAGWGADVREAAPGQLARAVSYYDGDASAELALWCPEDVYIEEPVSLIQAYLAAARLRGVEVLAPGSRPRSAPSPPGQWSMRPVPGPGRSPGWPGGRWRSRRSAISF